jgi:hypothetical protein
MRVTTHVTGPAPVGLAWERYVDPARWPTWAPQIRSVELDGRSEPSAIAPGVTGVVHAILGVRVRFEITDVDEAAHRWSWTVHPPGPTMRLGHTLDPWRTTGSRAGLVIDGPAPIVLTYAPLARLALHRLLATD